jgi:hypothetical protein
MPSPAKSSASRAQQRLRIAGILVLAGGLIVSVMIGFLVSGLQSQGGDFFKGFTSTNFLVHPVKLVPGQSAAFNWLFFLLGFGPALIASAVLFSGAEVCGAVARRTRSRSSSSDETIALGD